jgi:hypothetical protein
LKTRFFSWHVRPGAHGNSVKPRVNLLPKVGRDPKLASYRTDDEEK